MAERIKLGINYQFGDNWVGGKHYLLNLIKALKRLNDADRPVIYLIAQSKKSFIEVVKETEYPYLVFYKNGKIFRWREAFFSFLRRYTGMNFSPVVFDVLYPNPFPNAAVKSRRNIFWIPDFQELHYPQFFSGEEIQGRKDFLKNAVKTGDALVLSSMSAKKDLLELFPVPEIKVYVLSFAVSKAEVQLRSADEMMAKFGINRKYYALPNQFWVHKNHMVVFKAVLLIRDKYPDIQIVCTGREHDHRDPGYPSRMRKFIGDNDLDRNIVLLGFIDRTDQLSILNNALAVIQPSLFEGWNTSIEEAKSMNKFIIASDIDVHREQLQNTPSVLFQAEDDHALSSIIGEVWGSVPLCTEDDYESKTVRFAQDFMNMVREIK